MQFKKTITQIATVGSTWLCIKQRSFLVSVVGFRDLYVMNWASLIAQLVKNLPAMQETQIWFLVRKTHWRRERLSTPVVWPGKFHALYSSWGHKESDRPERLSLICNESEDMTLDSVVINLLCFWDFLKLKFSGFFSFFFFFYKYVTWTKQSLKSYSILIWYDFPKVMGIMWRIPWPY